MKLTEQKLRQYIQNILEAEYTIKKRLDDPITLVDKPQPDSQNDWMVYSKTSQDLLFFDEKYDRDEVRLAYSKILNQPLNKVGASRISSDESKVQINKDILLKSLSFKVYRNIIAKAFKLNQSDFNELTIEQQQELLLMLMSGYRKNNLLNKLLSLPDWSKLNKEYIQKLVKDITK